jgi:NAD(P)-dependent dehydrogenase (short-subunit alcohol dehydrogenase family)
MLGGRLAGKVAVVTGASSGVGRAIARAYAAAGARVMLLARDPIALGAAAAEAREDGGIADAIPVEVANAGEVAAAAAEVMRRWGAIDVWVNNAMVSVFAPVEAMTPDEYRRVMEVNYLGYVHGTLAALRAMRPCDRGVIIQVGSALAYRSIPLQSAYCASKAAIRGFTDSVRCELLHAKSGVAITQLHLPAVNTPQFEVVRSRLPGHPRPVPPIFQPEVIARAAVWLAVHPRRELWVGWPTVKAIVGQRIAPGLLDRLAARRAWDSQETRRLPPGHPLHHPDNVDAPLLRDLGTHGPFDRIAHATSTELWLRLHAAGVAVAALALAGVVALLRRRSR